MAQESCPPPLTPRSATAKYYHGQINIRVHEVKTCKQVNRKIFSVKKMFANVSSCNKLIDKKYFCDKKIPSL